MKKPSGGQTRFTAFITKYALTEGIVEKEVEDCFEISPTMVKGDDHFETYHGNEWHRSKEEAIARAEKMRADKLKSLDKQRKRIEGLKFS